MGSPLPEPDSELVAEPESDVPLEEESDEAPSFAVFDIAAVVGRVEAGALVVHRDGMEDQLQRRLPAHLAGRRPGLRHAVEHLEQMTVRAAVLVDRHGSGKASTGLGASLAA